MLRFLVRCSCGLQDLAKSRPYVSGKTQGYLFQTWMLLCSHCGFGNLKNASLQRLPRLQRVEATFTEYINANKVISESGGDPCGVLDGSKSNPFAPLYKGHPDFHHEMQALLRKHHTTLTCSINYTVITISSTRLFHHGCYEFVSRS